MCILAAQSTFHFNYRLYERLCPSVNPSVCWSVCPSEWKSGKTKGLDACVWRLRLRCGWGLDAPVHLSATLVFSLSIYDFFPTANSRLYCNSISLKHAELPKCLSGLPHNCACTRVNDLNSCVFGPAHMTKWPTRSMHLNASTRLG